jgi:hypothetical protein
VTHRAVGLTKRAMKAMISVQIIMTTVWVSVTVVICPLLPNNHGIRCTDVTMVQRGPTLVMSEKQGPPRLFGGQSCIYPAKQDAELVIYPALYSEGAPPTDIADRINASLPTKVVTFLHQRVTASIAEADR